MIKKLALALFAFSLVSLSAQECEVCDADGQCINVENNGQEISVDVVNAEDVVKAEDVVAIESTESVVDAAE